MPTVTFGNSMERTANAHNVNDKGDEKITYLAFTMGLVSLVRWGGYGSTLPSAGPSPHSHTYPFAVSGVTKWEWQWASLDDMGNGDCGSGDGGRGWN